MTALNLGGGILVYAESDTDRVVHRIRHSGKELEVRTLDISGTLDDVFCRVRKLADRGTGTGCECCHLRRQVTPDVGGSLKEMPSGLRL